MRPLRGARLLAVTAAALLFVSASWFTLQLRLEVPPVYEVPGSTPLGARLLLHAGSTPRYVTKSLAEVGATSNPHLVLFNHVPKAGGEMLVLLLQWLQGYNGFRHVRLGLGGRRLDRDQQEEFVKKVHDVARDEAVPVTMDRHIYFVNFTYFDRQPPTYINLVRDPVDKAASRFYYARVTPNPRNPDLRGVTRRTTSGVLSSAKNFEHCVSSRLAECTFISGEAYDLTIPYFCGHEAWCMELNNRHALEKAKANVERYFPVVGVLEELNVTLSVLEKKLPYFFKGVQDLYYKELLEPHKNKNSKRPEISSKVRADLAANLTSEYEFYYWLRARLLGQYSGKLNTIQ